MPDQGSLTDVDRRFLEAARRLSYRHIGLTAENPAVGALLVRNGRVVGRGVTAPGGRPHAERIALAEAGEMARGATAYVTLEPCAHHGRTSPCAEALRDAGIARVVIGSSDPDPRVDGKGAAILAGAGVPVVTSSQFDPWAIEGFLSRVHRGRPFVTLKLAVSADGFIGRVGEGQVPISGAVSRRQTHLLRSRSDAVLIGSGTAVADDPRLDVRLSGLEDRSPLRVVIDTQLRTSPASSLVRDARRLPTLIFSCVDDEIRLDPFRKGGVEIAPFQSLAGLLADLAERGIGELLCEGGARLAGGLLREGFVDRLTLVRSANSIGEPGIAVSGLDHHLTAFQPSATYEFGSDRWWDYEKRNV